MTNDKIIIERLAQLLVDNMTELACTKLDIKQFKQIDSDGYLKYTEEAQKLHDKYKRYTENYILDLSFKESEL